MEEQLFEHSEFNFESNLIRKDQKNIYNRLRSIKDDAEFVMETAQLLPELALVANERCGSWYIDQTKKKAYSAYFKSTDGHMGIWEFNIRRNNLHLLPILAHHQGGIIVDSTRKGKKLPDALSKTVPIWCCTLNRAVYRYLDEKPVEWDLEFHSPPSAVSRSEHAQIEAKMDSFVEKLLASGVDMGKVAHQLKRPLRPLWMMPPFGPPDVKGAPFWPVVCVSASEAIETEQRSGYLYVQGSGDDQEAWSMGLVPSLFWQHQKEILEVSSAQECESKVQTLVARSKTQVNDGVTYAFIQPTHLAVADGLPKNGEFDTIIDCSMQSKETNHPNYLHLPIPEGKKGQNTLASSIPKAIDFVRVPLIENKRILIFCDTGKDHSIGILLAILVKYFSTKGELTLESATRVDKKIIQHQLVRILANWEKASPSRTTLKKVNTYFMSHSALHHDSDS
ncbi:initiator tRNA phosphoribosyl transferase [Backusella circina FSU 941]|nr:initiator tRNA phosphoribosyl transferase [Backusella circina FSU 941]